MPAPQPCYIAAWRYRQDTSTYQKGAPTSPFYVRTSHVHRLVRNPSPTCARNILLNNAVSKLVGWAITRPDALIALDIDSELLELLGGGFVPRSERRRERVWRALSNTGAATGAPPLDVAAERQYEDRVPFDPKVRTVPAAGSSQPKLLLLTTI